MMVIPTSILGNFGLKYVYKKQMPETSCSRIMLMILTATAKFDAQLFPITKKDLILVLKKNTLYITRDALISPDCAYKKRFKIYKSFSKQI